MFSAVGHYGRYGTALGEIQRELALELAWQKQQAGGR